MHPFGWHPGYDNIYFHVFSVLVCALLHVFMQAYIQIPGISVLKFLEIFIRWTLCYTTIFALILSLFVMSNCFLLEFLPMVVSHFLILLFRQNHCMISFLVPFCSTSNPLFWFFKTKAFRAICISGRSLSNSVINLGIRNQCADALSQLGFEYEVLAEQVVGYFTISFI